MTDTSTTALQQIIAQLGAIVGRLGSKSAYQEYVSSSMEDFKKKREETQHTNKEEKDNAAAKLQKLLDLQKTPTLLSGEVTRYQNIAKIFNKVFNIDLISKSIDDLRKSTEESSEQRQRQTLLGKVSTPAAVTAGRSGKEESKKESGSIFSTLAKWGALAAALKLINDFITGAPGKLGPLTGLVDVITKWTSIGFLKAISNLFNVVKMPIEALVKSLTGKSIGENLLKAVKGLADTAIELASKAGRFVADKFATFGVTLSKIFPKLASNISSITSVFTSSIGAVVTKIGEIGAGKGLLGKIFTKLLGPIARITSKSGLKLLTTIPGIGALISLYFAYDRYSQGDNLGALIEVAAGLANLIPVPFLGSALSLGISMINVVRDLSGSTPKSEQTSQSDSWFSKALSNIGEIISEKCYDWPVIGPMIRVVEHFKAGNYLQALNSLVHVTPVVSGLLDLLGITETSTSGRDVGSLTSEKVKGMASFLSDLIMKIPGVGNVLKAIDHFISGNFEEGFAQILPESVMNFYRKTVSRPSSQQTQSMKNTAAIPNAEKVVEIKKNNDQKVVDIQPVKTKFEFDGLQDLKDALLQMSQSEISILTEQRNLLNDNRSLLKIIADNIGNISTGDTRLIQSANGKLNVREETSNTRVRYLESMNVLGSSLR